MPRSQMKPGTRFGPYRIDSILGAGGMGEVYLATDTRLDRRVAIKVLNADFAAAPASRDRFEREARLISSLNHPNICALYDVGTHEGVEFLVMEYVQGESLSERIARGPLAFEQVVRIGVEVAGALHRAHKQGIVHRDLKPGNIMLTKSGVKLLDFGLAKVMPASGSVSQTTPTVKQAIEQPLTQEGVILGTMQYMAPEQLEGREADARSDVFALGAILYEMATGQRAFDGDTRASVIAAILQRDPTAMNEIRPPVPRAFERIVRACLAKDPDERFQTAHDVELQLRWLAESPSAPEPVMASRRRSIVIPWLVAAVAIVAASAAAMVWWRAAHRPAPLYALSIDPPPGHALIDVANVSPDGRSLAFETQSDEGPALWLRRIDDPSPRLLTRPTRVAQGGIIFSPDNQWIAYSDAMTQIMRIRVDGGAPQKIAGDLPPLDALHGGSWSRDGTILLSPRFGDGIFRLRADGGTLQRVTSLDGRRNELVHLNPVLLPDGNHFLFCVYTTHVTPAERRIYAGSLDGMPPKLVGQADSLVGYAEPHLLFVRDGAIYAQRFDTGRLEVTGEARAVVDDVAYREPDAMAFAWLSPGGVLIYLPSVANRAVFNVYDRSGSRLKTLWKEPDMWRDFDAADVRLSRSGRMLLINEMQRGKGAADAVVVDLGRGIATRITAGPATNRNSVWSPDEQSIAFSSDRNGVYDVWVKAVDAAAPARLLWHSRIDKHVSDWSADGRFLLVTVDDPRAQRDIWAVPVEGGEPFPLVQGGGPNLQPQFSPDGKAIAYTASEAGRLEIFVKPIPNGRAIRVSAEGGRVPTWRPDGKELMFSTERGDVMVAAIRTNGTSLEVGVPARLFSVADIQQAPRFMPDGNILIGEQPMNTLQTLNVSTAWRARAP